MRVLTKSRFKLSLECPNKLFYTGKANYANQQLEDSFLQALAKGGFQVEALARLQYPEGVMIDTPHSDYQLAADKTTALLQRDQVVIFEAAFLWEGYFIRTDILVKNGPNIDLIEVKAKSFDSTAPNEFVGVRGGLAGDYKTYLFDLAFQKWVAQNATQKSKFKYTAHFLMADKSKTANIDGLNQLFRVPLNGNPRTDLVTKVKSVDEIGGSVLSLSNVDDIINEIIHGKHKYGDFEFREATDYFKTIYLKDRFACAQPVLSVCKKCEFRATAEDKAQGKLSGFENCMRSLLAFEDADFNRPLASEIWNYSNKKKIQLNQFMDNFQQSDFEFEEGADYFSNAHRQWIQVKKTKEQDDSIMVMKDALKEKMEAWQYPFHCIDFETSAVAFPFNKGRRPYEQTAFQFSHHILHADGSIVHQTEFINVTPGAFPNFEFARALKAALSHDEGTIFKYSYHENTIVNAIIQQLSDSDEADKVELIAWLKTISQSTDKNEAQWKGERNMVDLREMVQRYYYNPATGGSNSLKYVLPAILNSSVFLQNKYAQPMADINLTSKNFEPQHIWLVDGKNPYKNLPILFEGWDPALLQLNVSELDQIQDGGAAMTAYAKLQYTDMLVQERNEITKRLLQYCELDTLSMVMLIEHFKEITA